jgi:hypothetical protein
VPEWQEPTSQRRIFLRAYGHFTAVARQVLPQQYVTGRDWRTCRTKILDNALIGFCKEELGTDPASAWALDNGYTELHTSNEERNAPIQRLNAHLGYRPRVERIHLVGPSLANRLVGA